MTTAPRFPDTFCSQCGQSFGPGDNGYSHCEHHQQVEPRNEPLIKLRREMLRVLEYARSYRMHPLGPGEHERWVQITRIACLALNYPSADEIAEIKREAAELLETK